MPQEPARFGKTHVCSFQRLAGVGDADKPGPLTGKKVAVAGAMDGPLAALSRNQMNELIEAAGGRATCSVCAKTSLVVAGDKAGSKRDKAKELGLPIVTPADFAVLVADYLAM
ncbi:hypothetical protein BU198_25110 [Streptomyces sp. CBMA156]|nr:hypothetical protein [Streptomyces sp. CBMA156]